MNLDSYTRSYDVDSDNTSNLERNKTIAFLKATYQLFASSLLSASVGAYIGLSIVPYLIGIFGYVLIAISLILIVFVIPKTKHIPGINLAVLFVFTFITGLSIAPLLLSVFEFPNGASIVAQAFLMTAFAFIGISMFAMTTKKDYSSIGKFLFIALIILIVAGILNIFLKSSLMVLAISSVSALVFSAYILYDTQSIIKGEYETPIEASLALYLDFINLFVSLLRLLSILNNSDIE